MRLPLLSAALLACATACSDGAEEGAGGPAKSGDQVARFALQFKLGGFDPLHADSNMNQVLQRQVYESLVERHYVDRPFRYEPLLASHWETSADGRTWTFTLREDARFHDPHDPPLWPERERAVTAQDVVDSWLRLADARSEAGGWFVFEGLLEGLDAFRDRTADPADAEAAWEEARRDGLPGLRVLPDGRLELRVASTVSDLLVRLASPYAVVYPRESWLDEARPLVNHPVGSGPFHLAEWIPEFQARYARTPGWRGQPSPFGDGELPHLDEVVFTAVLESPTRTQLFRNGEIDRLPPGQDSFPRLVVDGDVAPELGEAGVTLHDVDTPELSMLVFNMADPVLGVVPGDDEGNASRRLLRRAIARAFPYERWHRIVRNGAWATPSRTFLPPSLAGAAAAPDCPWREQDLAAAAALLEQAGYPEGRGLPTLVFELPGSDVISVAMGEMLADALGQVGIEVDVVTNTWPELVQKMLARRAQMFVRSWLLDWPDSANLLEVFYGPNASPGINRGNFEHAGYDALFEALRAAPDGPQRAERIRALVEILNEELPVVPIDHRRGYLLIHPWLRNFVPNAYDVLACKYFRIEGRPE